MRNANPRLIYLAGEAEGGPGLKASRCEHCATIVLLEVSVCPRCQGRSLRSLCIGSLGILGMSSQVFHSADGFDAPYVIGEVRTTEGPRLFAPIVTTAGTLLEAGMPVKFVLVSRADGNAGFAYSPSSECADADS